MLVWYIKLIIKKKNYLPWRLRFSLRIRLRCHFQRIWRFFFQRRLLRFIQDLRCAKSLKNFRTKCESLKRIFFWQHVMTPGKFRGEVTNISIPTYWVGPLAYNDTSIDKVPLTTLETALAPSTNRGLRAIRDSGGCSVIATDNGWSRTPVFSTESVTTAYSLQQFIRTHKKEIADIANATTLRGYVRKIRTFRIGSDVYMCMQMFTGDASGHNTVTIAASKVAQYLCEQNQGVYSVAVSGDASDKKANIKDALLGHGVNASAGVLIPFDVCKTVLKAEPKDIETLVVKKNLAGGLLSGALGSANAHYANLLAATFLATGQDIANVVECSQGITTAEIKKGGLYFTVNLPVLVVGSYGNGKNEGAQLDNLTRLGCRDESVEVGANKLRLAQIIAGTVLAGELSLHGALATEFSKDLAGAHIAFERK